MSIGFSLFTTTVSLLFPTIRDTDDRIPLQHTIVHHRPQELAGRGPTVIERILPEDSNVPTEDDDEVDVIDSTGIRSPDTFPGVCSSDETSQNLIQLGIIRCCYKGCSAQR